MDAEIDPSPLRLSRALSRSFALFVAVRVLEALAVGWFAASVVLVCETLAQGAPRTAHLLVIALVTGFLTAGAVLLQAPPRERRHVRRLDRRLGLDGALVTAADVRRDAGGGALALALVRRVAAGVPGPKLARAALPGTPVALVAVALGFALQFAARDWARGGTGPRDEPGLVLLDDATRRELALASGALAAAAERLQSVGAPSSTTERARAAARGLAEAAAGSASSLVERRQLEQELDHLAGEASLAPDERLAARQARTRLDSGPSRGPGDALSISRPPSGASDTGAGTRSPAPGGSDPGAGSVSAPRSAGSTGTALASQPSGGTISGPDVSGPGSSPVPAPRSGDRERGVGALRWWPARHDAVVEAWLATAPQSH